MKRFWIIAALVGALSVQLAAKTDDVDYVELGAMMLRDGHVERADDALNMVDLNDTEVDLPRYYMIKGLVETKKSFYKEANVHFYKSIELNEDTNASKPLYLYIAQNSFKLKAYKECIAALDKVPDLMAQNPKLFGLKAECYWREGEKDAALALLRDVNSRFPAYWDAYKQRFYYLVSLGLFQAALEDAQVYLGNAQANETILINFINALRQSGQTEKAIELGEEANLRYPSSAKVTVMLAHLYIDKEMIGAAAELFNEASIEDGKYTNESAEMYRRARDYVMALLKNTQMLDTKEKYKQRIAIFLEYGDFERIIVTRKAMQRSGLMDEENMRYALAYAYYMEGEFEQTEALLETLTQPDLFSKAVELRKKMEKCKNNIWECQQ
ncbi:tetratricopeptide repeat protein [Thiomicrolovo sp. ZZH C-3]